jgi:hypothetical protein
LPTSVRTSTNDSKAKLVLEDYEFVKLNGKSDILGKGSYGCVKLV